MHSLLKLKKNLPHWVVEKAVHKHPTGTLVSLALKNRQLEDPLLMFILGKQLPSETYAVLLYTQRIDKKMFTRILDYRNSIANTLTYPLDIALLQHPLCTRENSVHIFATSTNQRMLYPVVMEGTHLTEEEKVELYLRSHQVLK